MYLQRIFRVHSSLLWVNFTSNLESSFEQFLSYFCFVRDDIDRMEAFIGVFKFMLDLFKGFFF